MQSTLVLNASREPLSIVSVNRAMALLMSGKAVSVDDSPRVMRSANQEFPVPYVIALTSFRKTPYRVRSAFSRRGVLVRDNFECAYCGRHATTIDHVIPRSKGGPTSYANCVAACSKCNLKKADKYLSEMGWTLDTKPMVPSWYLMALHKIPAKTPQREAWERHLAVFDPALALSLI